jgi:hypothetical protein
LICILNPCPCVASTRDRNELRMNVRALHKHVLWCITQPMTMKDVVLLHRNLKKRQESTGNISVEEKVVKALQFGLRSKNTIKEAEKKDFSERDQCDNSKDTVPAPTGMASSTDDINLQSVVSDNSNYDVTVTEKKDEELKTGTMITQPKEEKGLDLSNVENVVEEEKRSLIYQLQSALEKKDAFRTSSGDNSQTQQQREQAFCSKGNNTQNDTGIRITASERLGGYLHPRDMRRLVSPFSASNEPDVIVRRHVMLLNFDPLRAIILRDRMLVIAPRGADALLVRLENRLRHSHKAAYLGHGDCIVDDNQHKHQQQQQQQAKPSQPEILQNDSVDMDSRNTGTCTDNPVDVSIPLVSGNIPLVPVIKEPGKLDLINKVAAALQESLDEDEVSKNDLPRDIKTLATNVGKVVFSDTSETESISNFFDDAGEWDDLHNTTAVDFLPFELLCVDTVLHEVTAILTDDTYRLQEQSYECLQDQGIGSHQKRGRRSELSTSTRKKETRRNVDPLMAIRLQKDALMEMSNRITRFIQSMNRILDNDENMALMNLSQLITHPERFVKPVDNALILAEVDEPQLILEAHLQVGLTLDNALTLLQGQLNTSNDLIGQRLTSLTNRILFANTLITVGSFAVAIGSFVGSIMGMNVRNFLEDSDKAFAIITWSTVCGSFCICCFVMFVLIVTGTVPNLMDNI